MAQCPLCNPQSNQFPQEMKWKYIPLLSPLLNIKSSELSKKKKGIQLTLSLRHVICVLGRGLALYHKTLFVTVRRYDTEEN